MVLTWTHMHSQFQHIIYHQIPTELHGFNMNIHVHSQFHHIIYHQIPAKLHGFNMNTHMHSQFQHIIYHQIPLDLHGFNMNTHMHLLTQCIPANPKEEKRDMQLLQADFGKRKGHLLSLLAFILHINWGGVFGVGLEVFCPCFGLSKTGFTPPSWLLKTTWLLSQLLIWLSRCRFKNQ